MVLHSVIIDARIIGASRKPFLMSERDLLALAREMTNEDAALIIAIGSMALLETSFTTGRES